MELTGQVGEAGYPLSYPLTPETSGRYHTHWLNMMYPRLKLARNLLSDDGVIFISIDDTWSRESHEEIMQLDIVYGEE